MAEIQQGALAVLFGAPSMDIGINAGTALTFATGFVLQEVGQTRTGKEIETTNAAGVVINVTTWDLGDEVTIQMQIGGATRASAATANDQFPRKGGWAYLITATSITHLNAVGITGLVGGLSAATPGVKYGIKEASRNSTSSGVVAWTLVLRRSEGIADWVPL